ncbi:MAG: DUF3429 domain-containing protein [Gammaproteobacteria bacterium]|nr:DUF3429 family protein [Gammaproteobacteria bacterium]NIN62546.1 DUF3429 family protein [Gammaproteobacteria bacterium]NIO63109.1 DUF3429 family protein [Gammaproteobacteria bacterium]NIP48486.1 DUF3429 domain-containing protein [Gammaproteobacteria bacterium]NIQ08520.1 DUF3429 domain-containing protein [Gammaproteobacteria bacterium]
MREAPSYRLAYLLGYAGLLPFVTIAVLLWFESQFPSFFLLQLFHIYSILILVFLCGSWWGFAFAATFSDRLRNYLLLGSNLLFLIFLGLMYGTIMQNQWFTLILASAYLLFYIVERILSGLPIDHRYRQMRLIVTLVVVLSHISAYFAVN